MPIQVFLSKISRYRRTICFRVQYHCLPFSSKHRIALKTNESINWKINITSHSKFSILMKMSNFSSSISSVRYVSTHHTQTYIPLQSFNLENPLTAGSKKPTADVLLKKYAKSQLHANATTAAIKTDENFPVLKIEEDLDGISMTGCKTTSTSTQTSPIQEVTNKKGSTSTIWTSEESILRSADTVDEDNKSTSSSACEETGVAMSSDKSGEFIFCNKTIPLTIN